MGAYMVVLGIESIASGTLQRMNKNWTRKLVRDSVDLLKKYQFIVQANFILGFRDDTLADVRESIDFALELDVDQVYFGNYIPLPGTSDFNLLLDRGELVLSCIDWSRYSSYYGEYPYHPAAITVAELDRAIRKGTMRFYLRPRIVFRFLKRMTHPVFFRNMIFRLSRVFIK
jgi:magnesium-protoporphyrin IX monomethyl ester (oxidative) cyclase